MATSSILGADRAPGYAAGRDTDALGPSDTSDSGSDIQGQLDDDELDSDSDATGTGERASVDPRSAPLGADILPDRIVDSPDADASADDELISADADQFAAPDDDEPADEAP